MSKNKAREIHPCGSNSESVYRDVTSKKNKAGYSGQLLSDMEMAKAGRPSKNRLTDTTDLSKPKTLAEMVLMDINFKRVKYVLKSKNNKNDIADVYLCN